jgi:hypothetical protein
MRPPEYTCTFKKKEQNKKYSYRDDLKFCPTKKKEDDQPKTKMLNII